MPRWNSLLTTQALPVSYFQIPKAGCTSLMEALWKAHDRQTGQATYKGFARAKNGPWLKLRALPEPERNAVLGKETFTVLRDPVDRFWSAFHDKLRGEANHIQEFFAERYQLPLEPEFERFVLCLTGDSEPFRDRHFTPQARLLEGTRIDFWFRLDRSDVLNEYLTERIGETIGQQHRNPRKPVRLIGPSAEDALRRYYAADHALLDRAA